MVSESRISLLSRRSRPNIRSETSLSLDLSMSPWFLTAATLSTRASLQPWRRNGSTRIIQRSWKRLESTLRAMRWHWLGSSGRRSKLSSCTDGFQYWFSDYRRTNPARINVTRNEAVNKGLFLLLAHKELLLRSLSTRRRRVTSRP